MHRGGGNQRRARHARGVSTPPPTPPRPPPRRRHARASSAAAVTAAAAAPPRPRPTPPRPPPSRLRAPTCRRSRERRSRSRNLPRPTATFRMTKGRREPAERDSTRRTRGPLSFMCAVRSSPDSLLCPAPTPPSLFATGVPAQPARLLHRRRRSVLAVTSWCHMDTTALLGATTGAAVLDGKGSSAAWGGWNARGGIRGRRSAPPSGALRPCAASSAPTISMSIRRDCPRPAIRLSADQRRWHLGAGGGGNSRGGGADRYVLLCDHRFAWLWLHRAGRTRAAVARVLKSALLMVTVAFGKFHDTIVLPAEVTIDEVPNGYRKVRSAPTMERALSRRRGGETLGLLVSVKMLRQEFGNPAAARRAPPPPPPRRAPPRPRPRADCGCASARARVLAAARACRRRAARRL